MQIQVFYFIKLLNVNATEFDISKEYVGKLIKLYFILKDIRIFD